MKILSRLGELEFSKIWRLAWIGLKNPLLVLPTHKTTMRTMDICDRIFGDTHHADNKANAFRHALWNILIVSGTLQILKSEDKAISWAEKITTLHEMLMPNNPLEREMDLHNNKMGLVFFDEIKSEKEAEIISFLKRKASEAVKIETVEDIKRHSNKLVFIVE